MTARPGASVALAMSEICQAAAAEKITSISTGFFDMQQYVFLAELLLGIAGTAYNALRARQE